MKVKEAIKILQTFDPSSEVELNFPDAVAWDKRHAAPLSPLAGWSDHSVYTKKPIDTEISTCVK